MAADGRTVRSFRTRWSTDPCDARASVGSRGIARRSVDARPGFTLVELLIVLVLVGIVMTIAANSFRGLENHLRNATNETASFFRQTRSIAMASTSAYRVIAVSNTRLRTEHAESCAAVTWQPDTRHRLELRDGVTMQGAIITAGNILACFSARGVPDASPTFVLRDLEGNGQSVQVFLGGAVATAPTP